MKHDTCCRLSIIIPYKNESGYLRVLLKSIAESHAPGGNSGFGEARAPGGNGAPGEVQVIVVDDHSTENTEDYQKLQQEFAGIAEFYVNESANPGAGAARNTGIRKAVGEWLLFADADDCFVPGWYTTVSACYDSSADIIYFRPGNLVNAPKEAGRAIRYQRLVDQYLHFPEQKNEDRLRYEFIVPWSRLIRRSLITANDITFDEVMHANDNMFAVRCAAAAEEVRASAENIYLVRDHQGSLTSDKSVEVLYQRDEIRSRRYQFVKERLGRKRFERLDISVLGTVSMGKIIMMFFRGKCSFRMLLGFWKLFRSRHIRILPSLRYLFVNIRRLYRHFLKGKVY